MQTRAAPVFDPEEALSIVDGDKELLRELVAVFRASYPSEMSSIREALGRRDAEALRTAAHQFKGTLSAFGSGPAHEAAQYLERVWRDGDLSQAGTVYAEMERQVRALDAALDVWG